MTAPRPKSKKPNFKPWIEVSADAGEAPQGPGAVIALLHFGPRDSLILREYNLEGPPCEHLAGQPNVQDEKEIDKLIGQIRLVATRLRIRLKLDRYGIADLLLPDENTQPR